MKASQYVTGFCGTGQHEVCRVRWSGPCVCPCGHVASAADGVAPAEQSSVQLDLFGEEETLLSKAERVAAERAAWRARFERRWFEAPYDTAGGTEKGSQVHGWVCPGCGEVEWSEWLLGNNHWYSPDEPGRIPFGGEWGDRCISQMLRTDHGPAEGAA